MHITTPIRRSGKIRDDRSVKNSSSQPAFASFQRNPPSLTNVTMHKRVASYKTIVKFRIANNFENQIHKRRRAQNPQRATRLNVLTSFLMRNIQKGRKEKNTLFSLRFFNNSLAFYNCQGTWNKSLVKRATKSNKFTGFTGSKDSFFHIWRPIWSQNKH